MKELLHEIPHDGDLGLVDHGAYHDGFLQHFSIVRTPRRRARGPGGTAGRRPRENLALLESIDRRRQSSSMGGRGPSTSRKYGCRLLTAVESLLDRRQNDVKMRQLQPTGAIAVLSFPPYWIDLYNERLF